MKRLLKLILFLMFTTPLAQAAEYNCKNVNQQPGLFVVNTINLNQASEHEASLVFESNRGALNFTHVSCHEENSPDNILSCEDDRFSFLISLETTPSQAVLHPFVYENKEYGPFYFYCDLID